MANTIQSVDYQLQIARQYGAPLDKYTLFDTLQEAKNYAKTPRAYIGQILSVIEGGTVHVYFINYAMELEEVGGVVAWGEITGKPDVVTTNTEQTITAEKTITYSAGVNVYTTVLNGYFISLTNSSSMGTTTTQFYAGRIYNNDGKGNGYNIYFPQQGGTLALTSDIIHYTGATTGRGSVVVGIQVIGDKITAVLGDLAWENVTGKPSWIGSSKPSYSWDEITGKPDVVTTNTEQTITAEKQFDNPVIFCNEVTFAGDVNFSNRTILVNSDETLSQESIMFPARSGTLALTSDIIHYTGATTRRGSVVVGIQVIGDKITAVLGDPAWENVTGKPSWIGSSKPSYSWGEITGKPDVFTTNTEQTITAKKTFTSGIEVNGVNEGTGILISTDKDAPNTRIISTGLIRTWDENSVEIDFPFKDGTVALTSDIIHYTGATTGRGSVVVGIQVIGDKITAVLGDLAWENVTGKPDFVTTSDLDGYVKTSGGTITGPLFFSGQTNSSLSNEGLTVAGAGLAAGQTSYQGGKIIWTNALGYGEQTLTLPRKTGTVATLDDIDEKIDEAIITALNTPV